MHAHFPVPYSLPPSACMLTLSVPCLTVLLAAPAHCPLIPLSPAWSRGKIMNGLLPFGEASSHSSSRLSSEQASELHSYVLTSCSLLFYRTCVHLSISFVFTIPPRPPITPTPRYQSMASVILLPLDTSSLIASPHNAQYYAQSQGLGEKYGTP
jgi:hypothetical protein